MEALNFVELLAEEFGYKIELETLNGRWYEGKVDFIGKNCIRLEIENGKAFTIRLSWIVWFSRI